MKIDLHKITVSEIFDGYVDNAENGIVGYGGKLNIRPAFQREFVYDEGKRNAVIETVIKGFPLNVMYWCYSGNGNYELLDGQQRTISLCQYINGDFSLNNRYFHNLTQSEKDVILNYELMIYVCEGTDKEKLDWFEIINIAGVELTKQERRNAIFTGEWLHDAKRHFSKTGCVAYQIGNKYLNGSAIRQDYLQTVLEWISAIDGCTIENYMAIHQHDTNAASLWLYFQNVLNWVKTVFPTYRKEMKGIRWGILYNNYHTIEVDPYALENRIKSLMMDDDVQKKSGIYEYLLSGDERKLSIRAFSDSQKRVAYEKQQGFCAICHKYFEFEQMEGDHITPWCEGGATVQDNLQMLCKNCNRHKSNH